MISLRMPTKTKLKIARTLSKAVKFGYQFSHSDLEHVKCIRKGLNWELNLNEGIDLSIFIFGQFERDSFFAMKKLVKPGMTVLDIGANIGAHTLPLAQTVGEKGRVISVEPTDWAFKKLIHNINLNPSLKNQISFYQKGFISNIERKPNAIEASWDLNSLETAGEHSGAQLKSVEGAGFLKLDTFIEELNHPKIDFIKIDVDGYEVEVFGGGRNFLGSQKPTIVTELCPHSLNEHGTSIDEYLQILFDIGYGFFDEKSFNPLPDKIEEIKMRIPKNGSINVVASIKSNLIDQ